MLDNESIYNIIQNKQAQSSMLSPEVREVNSYFVLGLYYGYLLDECHVRALRDGLECCLND